MKRCTECGTVNPDINNFCGHCGMRLAKASVRSFAETTVGARQSTGSALSSLGVDDVYLETGEDETALHETALHDTAVPSGDPIKPAPYLQDEPIPDRPKSLSQHLSASQHDEPDEQTTISGPSFLGLTDSSSDTTGYLLEEDQPRSGARWFLFFVAAVAVFVAIGWLEWNSIKTGKINIPFLTSASSASQPKPAAAPTSSQNSGNAATANTATPGNADDRLITNDSSSADSSADNTNAQPPSDNKSDAKPADETAATESAQSRQAKEAADRRSKPAPDNSTSDKSNEQPAPAADSAKPSKVSRNPNSAAAPDPRQNKMLVLGEKYLYGQGVPRNCQQAMVYFRAAADDNNVPAMSHLGALYNTGECVKQDRAQAYSWLRRAHDADPTNQWIERDMNMLWRDMSAQERASISR